MPFRLFILLSLACLSLAAPSFAQGGDREDGKHVAALGSFQAGSLADALPRSIDLRPWLPPIGTQTMNDCVAWAFGYAGRTYLEAIDQGWIPNQPDRIFSPTFIYNQINHGEDGGSLLPDALDLLQQSEAATLDTAPYLALDYLTQPSAEAIEEAGMFRILDYDLVESVGAISLDPNVPLTAVATLSNGREVTLSAHTEVERGNNVRTVTVKRYEAFHQRNEDGTGTYRSCFLPQLPDADWRALESISYEITSTEDFEAPPTYFHDGGLPPVW